MLRTQENSHPEKCQPTAIPPYYQQRYLPESLPSDRLEIGQTITRRVHAAEQRRDSHSVHIIQLAQPQSLWRVRQETQRYYRPAAED